MTTLTMTFPRIGRNHDVRPLVLDGEEVPTLPEPEEWTIGTYAIDWDEVCERIANYAQKFLASRSPHVSISRDGEQLVGYITVGMLSNAGRFTVEVTEKESTPDA